ncbi:MAG TPA: lipoyl synthase [Planctomycetota bacterium]|jgi:lipoic acid synthetase
MSNLHRPVREFPPWLKKPWPARFDPKTGNLLDGLQLNTVCRSAECPNLGECFARGTATFLILGTRCTRNCGFCAVVTGRGEPIENLQSEPERIAQATKQLGLKHVVITSVTRDDLPDEGAGHFARTIRAVRELCGPEVVIEVLVPDFHAREECIGAVLDARPQVFNHNLETVERLQPTVRPQADYRRSLNVLGIARRLQPELVVKSGLMVGLGEKADEVRAAIADLREAGCGILTVGQYLQPSKSQLPVVEYVPPDVFKDYANYALSLDFASAACGPFVRSSYHAEQVFKNASASQP